MASPTPPPRTRAKPLPDSLVSDAFSGGHPGFAAVLDPLPIPAAVVTPVDGAPQIVMANPAFVDRQLMPGAVSAIDVALLTELVSVASRNDSGKANRPWTSEDPVKTRRYDVTAARIEMPGLDWPHFLVSLIDRTSEIETHDSFRRETMRDSLTGLPNRAGFEDAVESRLAEQGSDGRVTTSGFAIITLDIARFSQINECAGSVVGDELIITVARRLMGRVRKTDIVARIGGNEFALFVPLRGSNPRELSRITSRIRDIFLNPYRLSDLEIQIDGAIGIALSKPGQTDCANYIRQSQIALKRAKRTRQAEIYTPEELDKARRRFTLETELRKAIELDRLELYFQPLIDMSNGFVTGFEALARWKDPDYGMISPVEFIPVAEECGLILPLGRWALDRACQVLNEWDAKAGEVLPLKVSVNVSAAQFARDDIPSMVANILRANKTKPERLCLELTESVVVSDPARAAKVMSALRALNVSLAMDDFGTGYSNLAYLQQLPIDVLKIDRSFISDMLKERDKVAIVRAILSLASALGMETTAEGIETLEISQTLAALGCSFGQGYFYSPPVPADEAYAYMITRMG
ncbi:putative bifunctional diguanylate cyclase/phosphodiesterase [Blastomonas sp.]|uniref:putative bifunctional diguanylate cyclase/phosphodiesterase n=1 Tax=Blastomonas TaxID=150203 RepID=UPI0025880FF8|nr:bifunctional diguanylate cyclase/phosphodiesterase [Blastomonas sp.]